MVALAAEPLSDVFIRPTSDTTGKVHRALAGMALNRQRRATGDDGAPDAPDLTRFLFRAMPAITPEHPARCQRERRHPAGSIGRI